MCFAAERPSDDHTAVEAGFRRSSEPAADGRPRGEAMQVTRGGSARPLLALAAIVAVCGLATLVRFVFWLVVDGAALGLPLQALTALALVLVGLVVFGELDGTRSARVESSLLACQAGGIDAELSTDNSLEIWKQFCVSRRSVRDNDDDAPSDRADPRPSARPRVAARRARSSRSGVREACRCRRPTPSNTWHSQTACRRT